ncbi:MAG: PorT family protein [Bacteroides sp.]|nr:PorT family protein [Bacteroides sp.]
MKKEEDEIRELFRSRLTTARMPVQEGFWEKLQEKLPAAAQAQAPRIFSMFRYSAAAAVLVLIIVAYALVTYLSPNREIEEAFRELAITGNPTSIPLPTLPQEKATRQTPQPAKPLPTYSGSSVKTVPAQWSTTPEEELDSVSFSFSFSLTVTSEEEHSPEYSPYTSTSYLEKNDHHENKPTPLFHTGEGGTGKWSVAPYLAISLPGTDHSSGLHSLVSTELSATRNTTVKHKIPVTAGVAVRRALNKKVALESGLFYTCLRSELEAGTYSQQQKLHYIGFPLKAAVTLMEKRGLDLYLSAGGALEKCVSGTLKTMQQAEGTDSSSGESVRPNTLQASLTAAAGVQYRLNDRLALYAEPGLAYYFDDTTPVATLRKDKPVNFTLSCGVKIIY